MGLDRDTDTARRIGNALTREPISGNREASIHFSQDVACRHSHVFELQFGRVMRRAQRMYDAPDVKSWRVGIDDETGHAVATLVFVCARKHQPVVGLVGTADEYLAAVDDPLIAVLHSLGLYRASRIATAGRLGQAKKTSLFAPQGRIEIALFLIVGGFKQLNKTGATEHAVTGRVQPGTMLAHLDGD